MEYAEFERRATRVWEEIPDVYRSGVDGLVLAREAKAHPSLPDIYTLGECLTESYPSDWGGPDTTRSVLVLYYGSFQRLSELDPDFDWGYEVWETITHELRHHLESLATEDALEDVDYAMDENFKRFKGEPFDPFFYRSGEPLRPGVYQVERDIFIERLLAAGAAPAAIEFDWQDARYAVPTPEDAGDVSFIQVVEGVAVEEGQEVCVVVVRKRGLLEGLRRWFRKDPVAVVDVDATAERVG